MMRFDRTESGLLVPSDRRIVRAHEGRRPLQMGAMQQALLMAGGAGGGGATPILDTYGANCVAAWSTTRRLKTGVTNVARCYYSAGASNMDIAVDGSGDADYAALITAVGAGDAKHGLLYDQTGNSRDILNATDANRPDAIVGGVFQSVSGFPAAHNSSSRRLSTAAALPGFTGNLTCTVFLVYRKTSASNGYAFGCGDTGTSLGAFGLYDDGSLSILAFAGGHWKPLTVATTNTLYLLTVIKTAGAIDTTTTVRRNGVSVLNGNQSSSTPNVASQPFRLGDWANFNGFLVGDIIECLCYDADKAADLAAIEADIMTHYGL